MITTFPIRSLHIFTLFGFAVAQPLYDLLGKNAVFFVAQRAGTVEVLVLILILSLGLPALLVFGIEALGWLKPALGRRAHISLVGVLVALTTAKLAIRVLPDSLSLGLKDTLYLLIVVEVGLFAALGYAKLVLIQRFFTLMCPAIVLFPAVFLLTTPAASIFDSQAAGPTEEIDINNSVPIILAVFDEMSLTALLDENREIDAVRFPNLAALARDGWWFPNATAIHYKTEFAVPAILTGKSPGDLQKLPTVTDHPENLFTWLGNRYDLNVSESVTAMCPNTLCGSSATTFDARQFARDVLVVYFYVILPDTYSKLLPPIGNQWRGFEFGDGNAQPEDIVSLFKKALRRGRHQQFDKFLQSLRIRENALNFIHILLPHHPYQFLPSERVYATGAAAEGLNPDGMWTNEASLIDTAYLRYLLQYGFVDRLVGKLIDRLKSANIYDQSLIVITADHGMSIRPGISHRIISLENAYDILPVPMLVKLPGQRQSGVSDRRISGIDILPTIADVLGIQPPWPTDGHSMFAETFPERGSIEILGKGSFERPEATSFPGLQWQLDRFGAATPLDGLVVRNSYYEIVGQEVAQLDVIDQSQSLRVKTANTGLFDQVDLDTGFVPVLFRGELTISDVPAVPIPLAIALNGEIRATAETVPWDGKPAYFTVMLPESAFRDGRNKVEVFRILKGSEAPKLARIPFDD